MSQPNLPIQPPTSDKGVFAWDKVSGTWKIAFPLLIVAGVIAGAVAFSGMVTFQNGLTISNRNGIIYNGHFSNFTNNTGNILYTNGSAAYLSSNVHAISAGANITINGTTGTVQITSTASGGGTYNATATSLTSVTTGKVLPVYIFVNASSGSKTVFLTSIGSLTTNGTVVVVKVDSSANKVHVNTTSTDHIEGGIRFKDLSAQNAKIQLIPSKLVNGTGWFFDLGVGNQ